MGRRRKNTSDLRRDVDKVRPHPAREPRVQLGEARGPVLPVDAGDVRLEQAAEHALAADDAAAAAAVLQAHLQPRLEAEGAAQVRVEAVAQQHRRECLCIPGSAPPSFCLRISRCMPGEGKGREEGG